MNPNKIFCVGFNKTGTTTIKRCYKILGLGDIAPTRGKQLTPINHEIFHNNNYEPALKLAEKHTCFEDRPWNIWKIYQLLEERFPDAKFILTVRNPEGWWKSVERWISVTKPWMACRYREHLGSKDITKKSMIAAYENYNKEVVAYFKGKNKLLVIELEKGLGWKPLCDFFKKDIPQVPFPHANKQSYDHKDNVKITRRLRKKPWDKGKLSAYYKYISAFLFKKKTKCFYCDNRAVSYHPSAGRYKKELEHVIQEIVTLQGKADSALYFEKTDNQNIKDEVVQDRIGIVCCYINPNDSLSEKISYDHFYNKITNSGFTLLTVELIFPENGSRLSDDYQNVITVQCPDNLWSKEYLLNIGIRKLIRKGYQKIVWLEPKITANNTKKWMQRISDALNHHIFVQAFSSVTILDNQGKTICLDSPLKRDRTINARKGMAVLNLGWAARADLLKNISLYDRSLFGRGAIMVYIASFGYSDEWFKLISKITRYHFSCCAVCRKRVPAPLYTWHYLMWAQKWAAFVKGDVGCVEQNVTLLNENKNNNFEQKAFLALLEHGYDPAEDIVIQKDKSLQWSGGKPKLQERMDCLVKKQLLTSSTF